MNLYYDEFILERHVRSLLSRNFTEVFETSEFYNVRCNVCGDSKTDKFKKRGYLLKTKEPWVYYCHNCQVSMSVPNWMKEYYNDDYKRYMSDVIRQNKQSIMDSKQYNNIKTVKGSQERNEKEDTRHFKSILKFDDCIEFCENRKIPKDVYSKWYYAINGLYKGRIIIPFRNNETNKIYYFQGRKFNNKNGVKYLSRYGDHNSIYNYYNVDKSLPVIILEGPIDSIFVENSIAVTGLKLRSAELDEFSKKYFMVDNDNSGNKQAIKLLKKRKYVFNWSKFLKDHKCIKTVKDVNDFILHNTEDITYLTWDMLSPYFTNNIIDKIFFPVEKEKKPYKKKT